MARCFRPQIQSDGSALPKASTEERKSTVSSSAATTAGAYSETGHWLCRQV